MLDLGWGSSTGEGDADVSVLLLDANGKVRSDTDFYNYPVAADGSVQLPGKTPTAEDNEDRIGGPSVSGGTPPSGVEVATVETTQNRVSAWSALHGAEGCPDRSRANPRV
ncbi:hypothetical protein Sm713_36190 [Streptomyces sp. TS71-3]|nr:hypothetical protein Sm713_36190 [Streptomyces sp. TS71-3]